jgi:hypothetical protein
MCFVAGRRGRISVIVIAVEWRSALERHPSWGIVKIGKSGFWFYLQPQFDQAADGFGAIGVVILRPTHQPARSKSPEDGRR